MNALRLLQDAGVTVQREGEALAIETVTGTPLTAELIELARAHKAELLAMLPDPCAALRERLHAIAMAHGIDADIVRAIATADALRFSLDLNDGQLTRWLNIVGTRELYRRGLLKHGWAIPSAAHVQGTAA